MLGLAGWKRDERFGGCHLLKYDHVQGGVTLPVFTEEHWENEWKMSSKQLQKLEQKPQGEKRE